MQRMTIVRGVAFASLAFAATAYAKPIAMVAPADELKWDNVPGFDGLHMSVTQGNPAKGPSHFFLKFDKGFTAPEHHHTADHYVTVIEGTLVLTIDGKENRLGPGSYFAFTGKKVHATKCDPAADCLIEIDVRGKWDVVPEKKAQARRAPKARR